MASLGAVTLTERSWLAPCQLATDGRLQEFHSFALNLRDHGIHDS